MFTNINTKSLKGFLYCKFLNIFNILCIVLTAVLLCSVVYFPLSILYKHNKPPISVGQVNADMFIDLEVNKYFYFKAVLASISTQLDREEKVKEPLTGKALYLQYISEIVESNYPNLDRDMVAAIVYHESRFQPDVKNSKTGATGLMQILPKWHTERARKLGVTNLSDPYGNLLVGCDILNEVYQQSNSMDYALDVYAGGYRYANAYRNSISPYRSELNQILRSDVLGKE